MKLFIIGFAAGNAIGLIVGWLAGHWSGWCGAYDLFKDNKVRPIVENEEKI